MPVNQGRWMTGETTQVGRFHAEFAEIDAWQW